MALTHFFTYRKRGCWPNEETPVSWEWVCRNNADIHINWNFADFYLSELRHEFNSQLASHMHFYLDTLTANPWFAWQPLRMSSRQPVHYVTYINKPDYPTYITIEYIIQNNQNKSHIMYNKKRPYSNYILKIFFFFFFLQNSCQTMKIFQKNKESD